MLLSGQESPDRSCFKDVVNRLVLLGRGSLLGHDLEGCCGTRGVDLELLPSALAMTHCHVDVYSSRPPGSRLEPPKPSTNAGIAL